jgi:biopolymer transport protein ExbD
MTPMIDCVFQLLIFFMLSSSFLTPMLELALPEAKAGESTEAPDLVLVSIDAEGEIFINKDRVPLAELADRLRPLVAASKDKVVTVRGDKQMPFDHFVRAFSAIQSAGAARVDIAHLPTP